MVYGFVILSFLGGVHWGRALVLGGAGRFVLAVVPLAARLRRRLPCRARGRSPALSAAFAVAGLYDVAYFRRVGPRWYAALRLWLTLVVVVVALALVSFAAGRPARRSVRLSRRARMSANALAPRR